MPRIGSTIAVVLFALGGGAFHAQDYKANLTVADTPVAYDSAADDPVSRLQRAIDHGGPPLPASGGTLGILPALLDRLQINPDSQMLVFSKTSFQAARISPAVPRAVYFGDDAMVGYVPGAQTLEVAGIDPERGPVFYTMPTAGDGPAVRGATCLRCHHGPNTAGVPGIYIGSVIPGPTGAPIGDDTAIITDHRTAFRDRWGGWYVTAKHGEQPDRANAVASDPAEPDTLVRDARQNLVSLAPLVDVSPYLAPTSDIVALMTFEHQTQAINLMTRVSWEARLLESGRVSADQLESDVADLADYLLFSGEAPLVEPVEGVSSFARTFAARGRRDARGRSLRDFDLRTRLFRYPLSFSIYSASFDAIPGAVREHVYRRVFTALTTPPAGSALARVPAAARQAAIEIVANTKRDLPPFWKPRASPPRARHN